MFIHWPITLPVRQPTAGSWLQKLHLLVSPRMCVSFFFFLQKQPFKRFPVLGKVSTVKRCLFMLLKVKAQSP